MKKKFLAVIFTFITFSCFSEEIDLGTIVITPYRTAEYKNYLQNNVQVISNKEFEKEIFDFGSFLNLINGLNLVGGGKFGSASEGIFIRGAQPRHTGYFLEGIKIYDPSNPSSYYMPAHFFLSGIEQVEIVKTSTSSIYGSNPLGGAINFLVKKPQDKPYILLNLKGGSFKTKEEEIEFGGKIKDFSYLFNVARLDTEGFSKAREKNNNPEEDSYQNTNSLLRIDYEPTENFNLGFINKTIYARTQLDDDDNYDGIVEDDLDNLEYDKETFNTLYLKQKLNDFLSYKLQGGYTDIYRESHDDAEEYVRDYYRGKTYQFLSNLEINPFSFYKAILGFDYTKEKVKSYANYSGWVSTMRQTNHMRGFFLENIFKFFDDALLIENSIRREANPLFDNHWSKRSGITYIIPKIDTKVYFSYSEGFKAPSIYQLYSSSGNRNLKPEKSKSWEIGFSQPFGKNFETKVSYFHSDFKNLIDFIYIDPSTYKGQYENANKAKSRGVEFELSWRPFDDLTFKGGYSYLTGRQDFVDGDIVGWVLVSTDIFNHSSIRVPKHKIFMGTDYKINKFDFSFDLVYVSKRFDRIWKTVGFDTFDEFVEMKPYFLGNIKIDYKSSENTTVFLEFHNIFNKDYERIKGYQEEKFSIYGGLKLKF